MIELANCVNPVESFSGMNLPARNAKPRPSRDGQLYHHVHLGRSRGLSYSATLVIALSFFLAIDRFFRWHNR
jgi:hypothetical protein